MWLKEADIVKEWLRERGEKGKIETLREDIMEVLQERFGIMKKGINKQLQEIDDPSLLKFLLKKSIKVQSLEEFEKVLEQI